MSGAFRNWYFLFLLAMGAYGAGAGYLHFSGRSGNTVAIKFILDEGAPTERVPSSAKPPWGEVQLSPVKK